MAKQIEQQTVVFIQIFRVSGGTVALDRVPSKVGPLHSISSIPEHAGPEVAVKGIYDSVTCGLGKLCTLIVVIKKPGLHALARIIVLRRVMLECWNGLLIQYESDRGVSNPFIEDLARGTKVRLDIARGLCAGTLQDLADLMSRCDPTLIQVLARISF